MSSCFPQDSWSLVMAAVIMAATLSKDQTPEEITRMGTFFTVLGDTLALLALDPCRLAYFEQCSTDKAAQFLHPVSGLTESIPPQ